MAKESEKEYAKLLFTKEGLSQKDIATRVGVTEKTISKWVEQGKWKDLKRSILSTRTSIIANLQEQMELLQQSINTREDRLATAKEADMLVKLANAIKKLETELGIGEIVMASMELIQFVQTIDFEFAKKLTDYTDVFIKSKMK